MFGKRFRVGYGIRARKVMFDMHRGMDGTRRRMGRGQKFARWGSAWGNWKQVGWLGEKDITRGITALDNLILFLMQGSNCAPWPFRQVFEPKHAGKTLIVHLAC